MKLLTLILLTAAALNAQTTKTTVFATVVTDGSGNLATGGCVATPTACVIITPNRSFTAFAGEVVQPKATYVPITAGAFTVALYPNDSGVPIGTYYRVVYVISGSANVSQSWSVPSSGIPIAPPIIGVPPLPGYAFSPSQLLSLGASVGMALVWNGTAWAPNVVGKCKTQDVGITSSTFTHNLNSLNVEPYFKDVNNKNIEAKDWTITNANMVSYTFDSAKTVTACVK